MLIRRVNSLSMRELPESLDLIFGNNSKRDKINESVRKCGFFIAFGEVINGLENLAKRLDKNEVFTLLAIFCESGLENNGILAYLLAKPLFEVESLISSRTPSLLLLLLCKCALDCVA